MQINPFILTVPIGIALLMGNRTSDKTRKMKPWKTDRNGLEFIANAEGFSSVPYPDPPGSGKWSIGFGHQMSANEYASIKSVSREQALQIMARDIEIFERAVNEYVNVPLTQNEFNALVSLAYNIGTGAFAKSTVVRSINLGLRDAVPAAFRLWNKITTGAGLQVAPGLVARRENEIKLWLS